MRYLIVFVGVILLALVYQFGMSRPIEISASGLDDQCGGAAYVKSENTDLKARPTLYSRTILEMSENDGVILCERVGSWHGIILQKKGVNCLDHEVENRKYNGECFSGWVHESEVEFFAG